LSRPPSTAAARERAQRTLQRAKAGVGRLGRRQPTTTSGAETAVDAVSVTVEVEDAGSAASSTVADAGSPVYSSAQATDRERMFTFVDRATGLDFADGAGGTVLISSIEEGSAAGSQNVPRSGVVLAVNGISVAGFDKDKVRLMLGRVTMPMTVRVRDPQREAVSSAQDWLRRQEDSLREDEKA